MSIITITRGAYSKGEEMAKMVAEKLGYRCISREILLKASNEFNIPTRKQILPFEKGPSELEFANSQKEKYFAYIQLVLLRDYHKDDVVHHGVAGQFFVRGIEHGLKVLVIEDIEDRMRTVMGQKGLSRKDALILLKGMDQPIIDWGPQIFGIHPRDLKLYNIVIDIKKIPVDFAVDMICRTVGLTQFQTTLESQKSVDDLLLAAEVKWALVDLNPHAEVFVHDGSVTVKTVLETVSSKSQGERDKLVSQIEKIVKRIPGVKEVSVDATLYPIGEM